MAVVGAILGDIIGQPWEFSMSKPDRDSFKLFTDRSRFTDDSVMTIAVAEALLNTPKALLTNSLIVHSNVINSMKKWGRKYKDAGYGPKFYEWLNTSTRKPYGSWGNGSAMRVAAVGVLSTSIHNCRATAKLTAEVTHNHPEGIKGAQALAEAIWCANSMGRINKTSREDKEAIRNLIEKQYGYNLHRTCEDIIKSGYTFDVSCQGSVPEAIIAFLDGNSYEECVRNAVSLGGDADTLGCMTGAIAESFYGIPDDLVKQGLKILAEQGEEAMFRIIERVYKESMGR